MSHSKKAFAADSRATGAAKDVEAPIEKHTTKAAEKEEQAKMKQAQKEEQAAKKQADKEQKRKQADATKAAKSRKVEPAKPLVPSMPAPPGILERADASKVKVFENQDEFDRDKGAFLEQ